jgi:hypothetical protein
MRIFFLTLLFVLCLGKDLNAQFGTQSMSFGPSVSKVTYIQANVSSPGASIPSTFVGISTEVYDLVTLGMFQGTTGAAASYIGMMKLLSSNGVFRIGGAIAETVTPPALTQPIANSFASFISATGWTKVLYTLDLKSNNAATAASQAGFLVTAFGSSSPLIFQFGNEPIASGNFTTSTYPTAWNSYYTSVVAAVPGVQVAADDDFLVSTTKTTLPNLSVGISGLTEITVHYYPFPAGSFSATNPASTLINSVPNALSTSNLGSIQSWHGTTPYVMAESNSLSQQGYNGLSNTMAAATWFLSYGIGLINGGWGEVNIHNNYDSTTYYNPIVQVDSNNFSASPIFYGMYMLAQIEGQQTLPIAMSNNNNVAVISTLRTTGKANILISNNNQGSSVTVQPDQSSAWSTAKVLLMTDGAGQGCGDGTVLLGGQAIGNGGAWNGATFNISSGQTITLDPCAAALVQIQ